MLRPDTKLLWERLSGLPSLAGFVLIGGSALALHADHRLSEDLDFTFIGLERATPNRLPRIQIEAALSSLRAEGSMVRRADSIADVEEYERAGMDILDHQQNLWVDAVSVSFFMPDQPLRSALRSGVRTGPRLASLGELFASKALVAASRSRTRDWFDLYYLMTTGGYTIEDFARVYEIHADPLRLAVALSRLCSGRPGLTDEGFVSLLPQPPTSDEMRHFFTAARDRHEAAYGARRLAAEHERETGKQ